MKSRSVIFLRIFFILVFPLNSSAQILFEEVSEQIGIEHFHRSNQFMGGGVAVFDYDNDGWQDIYLTGGLNSDKLLHNIGNGQFEDVSLQSGIEAISQIETFGVITGDIDNDGFRDVLVTTPGEEQSMLFRNQGDGTFIHLPNAINDGVSWKSSATFGDVNKDGFLDVYIGAYVGQSAFILDVDENIIGFAHQCDSNFLFLNNGDLTFTDASVEYGVADTGCALAVAFTDFDNDLDPDLILANDFGQWVIPSALFENDYPTNQLPDIGPSSNMDFQFYGMGIAIGDYDKDADLDYYQTNLGRNVLSRNDQVFFTDVTTASNTESDSTGQLLNTGWGCFFFDADNDSWPDLFVANGEINAAQIIANLLHDPNKLYRNNTDGTFTDVSDQAGIASVLRARGAAYGDFDNDGRLDFVVNNVHSNFDSTQFELYHNISPQANWVSFQLHGVQSNRDAFGSHVRLVQNGVSILAEVGGGSSHASQNSSIVHFGLGQELTADSVIITFPSGEERVLVNIAGNQIHHVYEDITIGVGSVLVSGNQFTVFDRGDNLAIRSQAETTLVVEIIEVSGKLILRENLTIQVGDNYLSRWAQLSTGLYLIKLDSNTGFQTFKVFHR